MRRFLCLLVLFCFVLPAFAQDDEPNPYEIALQRIQEAEASGEVVLDLSGLRLTELPPEIGNLGSLEVLILDNNELGNLPPEIGKLERLYTLSLSYNYLSSLPPEMANLANLTTLYLVHNDFTSLPPVISQLRNLCHLNLWNNQLQYLPTELIQLENLRIPECYIYVDSNPLISPPQEVIAQGTPAILGYLENEAWWHLQRLIIGAATGFGIVAAFILGMLWRNRDKQKRKNEETSHA